MDALGIFLAGTAGRPFRYGEWDCLLRLADWGIVLSGRDAGEGWRGRCRSALGAARVLKRNGGIEAMLDAAFGSIGWHRVPVAGRGAIAAIRTREGVTGAILLGPMRDDEALVSQLGVTGSVIVRRAIVLAAWERA